MSNEQKPTVFAASEDYPFDPPYTSKMDVVVISEESLKIQDMEVFQDENTGKWKISLREENEKTGKYEKVEHELPVKNTEHYAMISINEKEVEEFASKHNEEKKKLDQMYDKLKEVMKLIGEDPKLVNPKYIDTIHEQVTTKAKEKKKEFEKESAFER